MSSSTPSKPAEKAGLRGQRANTQRRYEVTRADLPLSCPTAAMRLWDAHPRVYLPIEETGREVCPYCEAEFILTDFDTHADAH